MNQSTVAIVISIVGGLFSLFGVPGITSIDIQGFLHVASGIVSLAAIVWAHLAHKSELGRALAARNA